MSRAPSAARRWPVSVAASLIASLATMVALTSLWRRPPAPIRVPAWFARLPTGDDSRFFTTPMRMRKLRQIQETRNAIYASAERPLRQELTLQPGQRMQVAFTIVCPPDQRCTGGVRFHVTALRGAAREPLLQTRMAFTGSPAGWQTRVIDPTQGSDAPVTIELAAAPYGPAGTPRSQLPVGIWGEPLVVGHTKRRQPSVLLISLDTLRADHLGSYGYARPTSPALDLFAADGVRFAQAMSQSPWTTPAHMSLFTALYPSTHRVNHSIRSTIKIMAGNDRQHALAPAVTTLPELLRANGYHTLALTGGATMTGVLGFAQGFDVYREDATKLTRDVGSTLGNWLNTFGNDPFLLFLHTFEIHTPYTHMTFAAPLLSDTQRAEIM